MMSRKPAALTRIKDPHRTIEVACFLRLTLLRLTDASLTLLDHQIAALWRGARERVEVSRAGRLRRLRRLLGDLAALADDEVLGAVELRSRLRSLIAAFEPDREATQVAAIRQEFGRKSQDLARLLKLARAARLAVPADHGLAAAFATLDSLAASPNALPTKAPQPFGPSWQGLIDQPDRAAALGCFRAATLMALKRALRNRSVSVDHSLSYRAPEEHLMTDWNEDKSEAVFQNFRKAVAETRRYRPPIPPCIFFDNIMKHQNMSVEDVCKRAGMDRDMVTGLLRGTRQFDAGVEEHLVPWLGSTAKVLRGLQDMFDYFQKHKERPPLEGPTPELRLSIGE